MGLFSKFFGNKKANSRTEKQTSAEEKSGCNSEITEQPPIDSIPSHFGKALSLVASNGSVLYTLDREEAFKWYRRKEFPMQDYKSELGTKWFDEMAVGADEKGLWKEVWSGFHFALAGYLYLNKIENISHSCYYLGRTHTGQGKYDLASLYLEVGRQIAEQRSNADQALEIAIEQAVLAKLTRQNDSTIEMDRVLESLFPPNNETSNAKTAAVRLFNEGRKNHEWQDESNNHIKSCLFHASGFYEVSLELNRELHNQKGIAFNLTNLGDVWQRLGSNDRALEYWCEAMILFSEMGDQDNMKLIQQWMNEIIEHEPGNLESSSYSASRSSK